VNHLASATPIGAEEQAPSTRSLRHTRGWLVRRALRISDASGIALAFLATALIFGPGDYAASMGVGSLVIGSIDPDYPGDQWHFILSLIVTAARGYGLQAIDGPYTDIKNTDEYRRMCMRARQVGYDGKWVLHPDQVGIANEVFAPSQGDFDDARRLLAAYEHATQVERKGAVMYEGQMIDEASRKIAEAVVARGVAAGMSDGEATA